MLDYFARKCRRDELNNGCLEGDLEDLRDTRKHILTAMSQFASNFRLTHLTRGVDPPLECDGMYPHPANCIRWVSNSKNKDDHFFKMFGTTYSSLTDDMRLALKDVVVSTKSKDFYQDLQ